VLQVGSSLVPVRRSLRHNLEIKREGRESIVSAISVIIYIPKQICVKEGKLRTRPDSCAASMGNSCRSMSRGGDGDPNRLWSPTDTRHLRWRRALISL
jgi:hypothetical protein